MTQGASILSWRSAAMKVSVFQWPCGVGCDNRCPLGPQPRNGAMLVFTPFEAVPRTIDKDQALGVEPMLMGLPALPLARDIRALLLDRQDRFF